MQPRGEYPLVNPLEQPNNNAYAYKGRNAPRDPRFPQGDARTAPMPNRVVRDPRVAVTQQQQNPPTDPRLVHPGNDEKQSRSVEQQTSAAPAADDSKVVAPPRPMAVSPPPLAVTEDKLEQLRALTTGGLRTARKLVLVLDIDHTLLHATKHKAAQIAFSHRELARDTYKIHFRNPLSNSKVPYYVKLRPGVRKFLDELHPHFIIALYTMGLRPYAEKVMAVIDPDDSIIQVLIGWHRSAEY